jgi:hypothetical protein
MSDSQKSIASGVNTKSLQILTRGHPMITISKQLAFRSSKVSQTNCRLPQFHTQNKKAPKGAFLFSKTASSRLLKIRMRDGYQR